MEYKSFVNVESFTNIGGCYYLPGSLGGHSVHYKSIKYQRPAAWKLWGEGGSWRGTEVPFSTLESYPES